MLGYLHNRKGAYMNEKPWFRGEIWNNRVLWVYDEVNSHTLVTVLLSWYTLPVASWVPLRCDIFVVENLDAAVYITFICSEMLSKHCAVISLNISMCMMFEHGHRNISMWKIHNVRLCTPIMVIIFTISFFFHLWETFLHHVGNPGSWEPTYNVKSSAQVIVNPSTS